MKEAKQSDVLQACIRHRVLLARVVVSSILALAIFVPALRAQDDFDQYKIRFSGDWIYSSPTGSIQGATDTVPVNIDSNLHFQPYSTFNAVADWRFTRKNHLYFVAGFYNQSRQITLNETIVFRNQSFNVGLSIRAAINNDVYSVGYRRDIIRRKHGNFGIDAQINVASTTGTISAAAQVNNGTLQAAKFARGSLVAPLPVLGPEFRVYPFNTSRFFIEGKFLGMYFGGYGSFLSARGGIGVGLTKHISVRGGYALASRLDVSNNGRSNRLGVNLTQQGPMAGVQVSF